MKRTTVSIPEPALDQLKKMAEKLGIPLGELIRRALDDYIARQK